MTYWWQTRRAVGLAMLVATMPLWFVSLPPLIDLLGHMGRYHIQLNLADSPALQANWDYRWLLIGNLGSDLAMELLGRIFGVERGAVILGALLVPIMMAGMVRLARAVHGHVPATIWAAFPFAMAYPWHYGLVNFWMGIGLALHAAAWAIAAQPSRWQSVWLGIVALGLWVVHIYGWVVFGVLIVAFRLAKRDWRGLLALWPLAAPLIVMAVQGYGSSGNAAATLGWFDWRYKGLALLWTLRDQSAVFDLACLAAVALLMIASIGWRTLGWRAPLAIAAVLLVAAIAIIPYQLLGSAYADARLWPVAILVALLAIDVRSPRAATAVATAAAAVFVARIAVTTWGFAGYDRDFALHLRALDRVERGARIAVLVSFPCDVAWRRPRIEHLDALVIVRRDAFTNGQWDVPGAQTLIALGGRGTPFNADPSQLVRRRGCPVDLRAELGARIARVPRDRFGYVWVLGFAPASLPRYEGLQPIYADAQTILYRTRK